MLTTSRAPRQGYKPTGVGLHLHDPAIITKHNPSGIRPATQHDIDHLQRVSIAYAHLVQYLSAFVPSLIQDAENIISGQPHPRMTEDELAAYMDIEDAKLPKRDLKADKVLEFTFLDHEGNHVSLG